MGGFYESYFQRGNHPDRPLAFWIRYTVFCPKKQFDQAIGELWAIYFDGERNRITAVRETVPISACHFSPTRLDVRIGDSTLTEQTLNGRAASSSHILQWTLEYTGEEPPLLLLPERFYEHKFPKSKVLVGVPNAVYSGRLIVDGYEIPINSWRGSQNHNWGNRHADHYAWAQVAGFDNAPDTFLECFTAQLKLGPFRSPRLTSIVLREDGRETAINGLVQALRAYGSYDFFSWSIESKSRGIYISGRIHAPAGAFVGLRYPNPPGGKKTCLNTKLATAEFTIYRRGESPKTLIAKQRAAFEILTDREDHGIHIVE